MRFLKLLLLIFIFSGNFLLFNLVKAQPPAISDLVCFSEIPTAGAIQLTWIIPTGAVAYEVKYAKGKSIDYFSAQIYNQYWEGGLAGEKKSEKIFGLDPGKEYTIAIKSRDKFWNWSGISNSVTCKSSEIADRKPPFSEIEDPKDGETILAGKDYLIKGKSTDEGGSSVQKVEISLDGGKTWLKTTPVKAVGSGFDWEYLWKAPAVGEYTLKTRASDWFDNVETPGAGIKVSVVKEFPVEKPPVEKPITEMTVEELKAEIVKVQQKIIELLTKLIQLIQEQISGLLKR